MGDLISSAVSDAQAASNTISSIAGSSGSNGATTSSGSTSQSATTGPASGLFGGLGNLVSSFFGGKASGSIKLPQPNILSTYASYDYLLSFACLSPDEKNYPLSSYIAGKISNYVFKDAYMTGKSPDYYMTGLDITSSFGFDKESGNTNNLTVDFTVVEPYSMGGFVQSIQTAAYKQGYKNYNDATYLIVVQFRGNTETGTMANIAQTKYIPIKLTKVDMKVTHAGSSYHVQGYVANAEAMLDSYVQAKDSISIQGETVQEVLQSGPNSLQSNLNRIFIDQKAKGLMKDVDKIIILLPTDISSASAQGQSSLVKPSATSNTTTTSGNQFIDPKLLKQLGVTASSVDGVGVSQDPKNVNVVGQAKVGFDTARTGTRPFPSAAQVYDASSDTWTQASVQANPKVTEFQFAHNTTAIDIINRVIMMSEYAVKALDASQIDSNGMRPWWRVDTQVYHIASKNNETSTGLLPKVIVYRVVPYGASVSKLLAPGAGTPGVANRKKTAPKVYNYIYSGKNSEVLAFDINIKNNFISMFASDNFQKNQDVVAKKQNAPTSDATKAANQPNVDVVNGGQAVANGAGAGAATSSKYANTGNAKDNATGTRGETEVSRAANLFHEALCEPYDMINCDMTIVGDPYYIGNSGTGNYTAKGDSLNVTKDGDINYQAAEVNIIINFRTASDINPTSGLYTFASQAGAQQFSGLYKLTKVVSTFKDGKFTQVLSGYRVPGQDTKAPAKSDPKTTISSDKTTKAQADKDQQATAAQNNAQSGDPTSNVANTGT